MNIHATIKRPSENFIAHANSSRIGKYDKVYVLQFIVSHYELERFGFVTDNQEEEETIISVDFNVVGKPAS